MEIRKIDNTAFRANVFAKGKTSVETARLAIKRGFIKDEAAVRKGGVYKVDDGYLALDPRTLTAKLIKLYEEAKENFLIGSPEGNEIAKKFYQVLQETAKDSSTVKITL